MTTGRATPRGNGRLSAWAVASISAYLAAVAGLVATVSVMRAFGVGAGTGASEALILLMVVLTVPLSTAYYAVGTLGSSQGSEPGEFAVGALSVSAALYYLGFFLLAALNAAVFRWVVLGTRRRKTAAQSDS
ncbi:hypothetical protein E3T47_13130 [Cryobacterium ruanii]|uniref:Uncharacterized protein n=1 Tax=Cryobacterium ruanii TaxID=1259197 RepID=A0A4R9AL22_9MICO|nr:hypothetical protein E3T47_13130 [Cryobacterium ruanii]